MASLIKNLKFQKKIIFVCLLTSFVPVILLGYFCYHQIQSLLIERERTALADTLKQEGYALRSRLNDYESTMNHLIWNENILKLLNQTYDNNFDMYIAYRDTIDPLFFTMRALNPNIETITIYTDLNIYPHGKSLLPLHQIENTVWYPKVCNNYKTAFVTNSDQEDLFLVCQFYNIQHGYTAFLKLNINYGLTFAPLSTLYENSYGILIVDEDAAPIFQFQTQDMQELGLSPQRLIEAAQTNVPEKDFIMEALPDLTQGWSVYLYRPVYAISSPAQIILQTVLIIIVFCILWVILVSSVLSNTIVRPLKELMSDIENMEQGTFTVTVSYDSRDEIGCLIQRFKSMNQQMNHLVNEILRGKILQKDYEMRALQAQINPHFLYNTLSLINSHAILSGQKEIGQMAQFLSTFYRTTLNKGQNMTSVKNELENVRSYVSIQLLMHSNSFTVRYHIAEEILPLSMINLLLQPLVENAIIHGIDHRTKQDSPGLLEITGQLSEGNLVFRVTDNGAGIPSARLEHILSWNSKGYGVQNVHNRVRLSHGSPYGLSYQSQTGIGTTVTLTLPAQPSHHP